MSEPVTLKPVGFWRQSLDDESELPHPSSMIDRSWPLLERVRLATYLRNGEVVCAYHGFSFCRLECGVPWDAMGCRDLTDGEWVWPEGFAHYVEHHAVKPPREMLDAVAKKLPWLWPWWRIGAAWRAWRLARRIAAARRAEEAEKLLPPHTTDLHEAARTGDLAAAERALERIAVDAPNRIDQTPLLVAASAGHVDVMRLLLARGADPNRKNDVGTTALCEASGVEASNVLLDAGAEVEPQPLAPSSPLTNACMNGDLACVELLLDRGANANNGDKFRTPLECTYDIAIVRALLARGADARIGHPLAAVARTGDVEHVRLLLASGAAVNARDTRDQTALFHAATAAVADDVVEILLDAGADPNVANDLRDTALHMACARTSVVTVKRLLEAGANVQTKSKRGMTPLHWAALAPERRDDAAEVIALLLDAGARGLEARDEWGRTPASIARERNDEKAVEALSRASRRGRSTDEGDR